ncbi:phosphoribosylglycinamide formyltransferase [Intestinimonas butyriciproducens]|uniref:phosphoribosylglycinamide formyltransferase n=1 Tax=Intestinimonas butyriciproducens TaxID=1297617 RepID=UPI00195B4DB7|nr:phosphoribosylglycinamide formyltransferase [Intestinimonas butyriciproducens]
MVKIGVLVSGGGTNLQALLDAQKRGEIPDGEISLVIASRKKAYALERARMAGVPALALPRRDYEKTADYDAALLTALQQAGVELVVLAGFLCVLGEKMLKGYEGRIVNVHPSLIPAFCGDGFYGLHVHEAALRRGVKVTGATVHLVNEVTDGGPILLQKAVEVLPNDTPESLQKRVMEQAEWVLLPQAVSMLCQKIEKEKHQ